MSDDRQEITVSAEVIYAHSTLNFPLAWLDEKGVRLTQEIHLTADEVWIVSDCIDCGLPLVDHPEGRKKRLRRRYCRAARRLP